MKNFKRVISAVIALALSASTLVAVSASKFADVDNTNYAEAIEVLTALDIAHGYEEEEGLVFKPEGEITRAEAATLIVGALNMMNDAKAAAGTSKFTDVNEKASWASGYVNVGVAQGFINGMNDTTFAPQENVTYAQMCVMLTKITGYGDYAEAYGGWPTGYTTMAASAGINKGVAVANDTPLKRGQVAQMLYNAMKTPMLGVTEYSLTGNTYAPLNGSAKANGEYQTLLSDKFEGYTVTASIQATAKQGQDNGKVKIKIEKADYWNKTKDYKYETTSGEGDKVVSVGDVKYDDYLYQSGTAVLIKDELTDNYNMVYFTASSKVETKEFAAADYDKPANGGKKAIADGAVSFNNKDYKLANSDITTPGITEIYVNNALYYTLSGTTPTMATGRPALVGTETHQDRIDTLFAKAQGNVVFKKTSDSLKGYDKVMLTCYNTAKLTSITYNNGTTTIMASPVRGLDAPTSAAKIIIEDDDVADGSVDIKVTKNGEAAELSNLVKGDIISYAADSIPNPKYVEIFASDNSITGKVSAKDPDDEKIVVDGEEYSFTDWTKTQSSVALGNSYVMLLDAFGRVYSAEVEATVAKFAIAYDYNSADGLRLILPGGKAKYFDLASGVKFYGFNGKTATAPETNIANATKTTGTAATDDSLFGYWDTTTTSWKARPIIGRVVRYTAKASSGEITEVELLSTSSSGEATLASVAMQKYIGKTGKLDGHQIIDSTDVIETTGSQVNDQKYFAASSFVDEVTYNGVVVKAKGSTAANFVVLDYTGAAIGADSRFAVVRKAALQATTANGDDCYRMEVLYKGEETTIDFASNPNSAVNVGDAFYFTLDNDGLANAPIKVFDVANYAYEAATHNFATEYGRINAFITSASVDTGKWSKNFYESNGAKNIQLVYGIITNVKSNQIEFGVADTTDIIDLNKPINATNNFGYQTFAINSDTYAYRYGKNDKAKTYDKFSVMPAEGVAYSVLDSYDTGILANNPATNEYNISSAAAQGVLTYGFAMVVDKEIVDLYVINQ